MSPGPWPRHPILYEVNTWAWLGEVSARAGRAVGLGEVPEAEWDALAAWSADAVWLMGVWERSPEGRRIALADPGLVRSFGEALPDLRPEADVVGSPYCVRRYVVDARLGGPAGLAAARAQLARRGIRLMLDLVPNHVAPDHPWTREAPDRFVRGTAADLGARPQDFLRVGDDVFARGRDPHSPPWPDVLQLNAFAPTYRRALAGTLAEIAGQCDGVRTDMAMLLLNRIFAATWGERAGPAPARELWEEVLGEVRRRFPGFRVVAEAYWDTEFELQQLGFDACYDKRLHDRLVEGAGEAVMQHLSAALHYQERLVRFTENHDEPRAAAALGARSRAAALAVATLPGDRLFHEGQAEGRKVRLPVFLGRRPDEPIDLGLADFHRRLLAEAALPVYREGRFATCRLTGWDDNRSFQRLAAWCWVHADERRLVVVNLGAERAQALVQLPWPELARQGCRLQERLDSRAYERAGSDLAGPGLYVDLEAGGWHLLSVACT
ncbi:MAG: alpha-amylase family glycosyl hydrolase [Anaeromyxobacter sp.]